jgi:four helix bundle protein
MEKFKDGFRKLLAWQKAHELTKDVYRVTQKFPKSELYGMTSQLQRASSSIAAQIAEGSRMPTAEHRRLYYDRAYASAAEVDYFLELAHDLHYLNDDEYDRLLNEIHYASALVHRLSVSCTEKNMPH